MSEWANHSVDEILMDRLRHRDWRPQPMDPV